MVKSWVWPLKGFIKVNVHAFTLEHPMPNGNDSGIVIVLRDRKGTIIKMYLGTIRDSTKRGNELWAMLIGLKGDFLEDEHMVKLESDNKDAVKEWEEWKWNPEPNHANVIQQLNQRKSDPNLNLVVRAIDESQNALARYLVHVGSQQRTRLVVIRRLFGQVKEQWSLTWGWALARGSPRLCRKKSMKTGFGKMRSWRRTTTWRWWRFQMMTLRKWTCC